MSDYRLLLRDEFARRKKKNPGYSLRAFARDLAVSPAFLTLLFSGKKGLSEERAHGICDRLGWSLARKKIFLTLVRYGGAKSAQRRADILETLSTIKGRDTQFTQLKLDTFKVIADWHHYAILELSVVEGFTLNSLSASRQLGIERKTASEAISRLKRLRFLKTDDRGMLVKAMGNYATFDIPSEAIRRFHRQMLEKAIGSIESQGVDERDLSGITMAIDPALIPKARAMIRDFANELMELMESGNRKAVYQFSVQLFRLSKGNS